MGSKQTDRQRQTENNTMTKHTRRGRKREETNKKHLQFCAISLHHSETCDI